MQLLLSSVQKPPVRFTRFAGSLVVHVVLLATAMVLSRYVASGEDDTDWSRFRVEPIRLHESVHVFFAPSPERARLTSAPAIAGHRAKHGPTVLEPEYFPEAVLPSTLPPLAHWSRMAPPDLPKPAAQRIITPGRVEAPSAEAQLTAPPVLSVPNRETATGDVNISLPPASSTNTPAVAVANSSTMPIKAAEAAPGQSASFDMTTGQPVNVIALSESRTTQPYVVIPRGLQNVELSDGLRRESTVPGSDPRDDAGRVSRRRAMDYSATSSNAEQRLRGPEPATLINSRPGVVGLAESELKRINHAPNGSYDMVVTQSAASRGQSAVGPNSASGPVYTVYLPVGDEKEWVLEFCGLAAGPSLHAGYQVMAGDDGPIAPPYPISTVIPTKLLAGLSTEFVLHGSITAAGKLDNFRSSGPASALHDIILQLMEEWRFRPATRNRTAIDVEITLIIPARS
jgi:hypothetical protein